jgi:hypothetical protein
LTTSIGSGFLLHVYGGVSEKFCTRWLAKKPTYSISPYSLPPPLPLSHTLPKFWTNWIVDSYPVSTMAPNTDIGARALIVTLKAGLNNKLIPFAKKRMKTRPGRIVQDDKAPAHVYHFQAQVYSTAGVQRLIWCGNSPDLNAIELVGRI